MRDPATELIAPDGRRVQRQARMALLRRIKEEWKPGTALAPLRELSRDLGVAYGTLRGAVRSLVKAGYLVSMPRRGTFVAKSISAADEILLRRHGVLVSGKRPNVQPMPLAGKTIEVRRTPTDDAFVGRMVSAFSRAAEDAGAIIRIQHLDIDMSREKVESYESIMDFRRCDADAAAIFNTDLPVTPREGQPLVEATTGALKHIRALQGYDLVTVDQIHGARLAARWLREAGCRRPAFMGVAKPGAGGLVWSPTSIERYRAFCEAWGTQNVPTLLATSYSVRFAALATREFAAISPRPDGLFAASDELAVGFLLAADAHGLLKHRPVRVVGFDGQERVRSLNYPSFATVAVPAEQMGISALDLLASRIQNPALPVRRVHVGCSLMSCGSSPPSAPIATH